MTCFRKLTFVAALAALTAGCRVAPAFEGVDHGGAFAPEHAIVPQPPIMRNLTAMPRVRGLADTAAQRRVNAELARFDRQIVHERRECEEQAHEGATVRGDTYPGISFFRDACVTYDSPRYLSLEVHVGHNCNGTYPTHDNPRPATLDLTTGQLVDWDHAFVAHALPADSLGDGDLRGALLGRRYLAHYRDEGVTAADSCETALATWNAPVLCVS